MSVSYSFFFRLKCCSHWICQVPASGSGPLHAMLCEMAASQVAERADGQRNLRHGDQVVASASASASASAKCKRNLDAGGEHQGKDSSSPFDPVPQTAATGIKQGHRKRAARGTARRGTQTRHMLVERAREQEKRTLRAGLFNRAKLQSSCDNDRLSCAQAICNIRDEQSVP